MSGKSGDDLLARLALMGVRPKTPAEGDSPAAPSSDVRAGPITAEGPLADKRLDKLLRRISDLTGDAALVKANEPPQPWLEAAASPRPEAPPNMTPPLSKNEFASSTIPTVEGAAMAAALCGCSFVPVEPQSFHDAGLTEGQVEALLMKYLLSVGTATGRAMADQVKLPFKSIDDLLAVLKNDQLVVYYGNAPMNDYVYQLTDTGRDRARRYLEHSAYFGAAPVTLYDYIKSVKSQSLTTQRPTRTELEGAFSDLLINKKMLMRLGPAINSGRGMFLYGAPGNGKTSIAERVTAAFGTLIWIPRAISIDGEIMRLYDPASHEEVPLDVAHGLLENRQIDKRWIRIRRPTIVVGGELTMENLEATVNRATGVYEAPLQLKSNCGTLVIDDFGRQKMSTDQLLNRWIVPLEKRYDFLNLASGKKIQVPFDQLIIFSTNLEPKDLVDDAFLRRIPYKIRVEDPNEAEFRELMKIMAGKFGMEYDEGAVSYLIEAHYQKVNRPLRCCQPRDLLLQIRNYCAYTDEKPRMSPHFFDLAVENYFAIM